jgi:hypothetical protein
MTTQQKKQLIKKLNAANTPDELTAAIGFEMNAGDISYRGGNLGYSAWLIADLLDIDEDDLPRNYGCYCNYLGDGIRGAICASGYNKSITGINASALDAIADACIRMYNYYEQEAGLQAEEDEDGGTNWDNMGSNMSRAAGIKSAY